MHLTSGLKQFARRKLSTRACRRVISEFLVGDHFQSLNATDKQPRIRGAAWCHYSGEESAGGQALNEAVVPARHVRSNSATCC